MEVIINDNKLVIITEPKTIHFDLPKDVGNNLKHKIYFIIKCNAFLAEHTIKNETGQLLSEYKHGNDIHEQQKPMKQIGHLNLFLACCRYYILETQINMLNIRQQYKNDKLKRTAPTSNDEFELHDHSYPVQYIPNYIQYIVKKHKLLPTNPPIRIYINSINNRLVLKIKDRYKLELKMPETMKLFSSTQKNNRQNKEWRKCTKP